MILRSCIRIATVLALRGQTWAGDRVLDSNNAPLPTALKEKPSPFVTVFTDRDHREVDGRAVLIGDRKLNVVIEFGLAGKVESAEHGPSVEVPSSDAGFELVLDVIEAQIMNALITGTANEFGDIWRVFCSNIHTTVGDRAGEAERGTRWAARQLTITVDTLADPPVGQPLSADHPVRRFLERLDEADIEPTLRQYAALLLDQLSGDAPAAWQEASAMLGLASDEVAGIGLGVHGLVGSGDPVDEITIERDAAGDIVVTDA